MQFAISNIQFNVFFHIFLHRVKQGIVKRYNFRTFLPSKTKQNKTKLHTPHSYLATFCHHRPEADVNFCPSATAPSEHVTCREPRKICPFPSEFFHPKNVEWRLSRSQCESSLRSFSLLGNISSDEHTPFYLTIYKLIDIWSVSTFFKNYFEGGYACSCTRFWMGICFILGLHLGLDCWVIR